MCWTFGNNSELKFKLRHIIQPTPPPPPPDTSYQTLLPEQKTLVICWHVDLPKENIPNHIYEKILQIFCRMLKSAYYFLHEQAMLLRYCAEEGDIPESPFWIPE